MTQFCRWIPFLVFLFAASTSIGQQLADHLPEISAAELEQNRRILSQRIDPSLSVEDRLRLHRMKDQAAVLLNDMPAREANLLEWVRLDPEAKWSLRGYWWYVGQVGKAIEVGRELVASTTKPFMGVVGRAFFAKDLIDTNQLEEADSTLGRAEQILRHDVSRFSGAAGAFWANAAEMHYFKAKAALLAKQGKWAEAEEVGLRSIASARKHDQQIDAIVRNPEERDPQRRNAIYTFADMASLQASIGKWVDAQWSLREAAEMSRKAGYKDTHMYLIFVMTAKILNGLGSHAEALRYARNAEALQLGISDSRAESSRWMNARIQHLVALAGLEQWAEASRILGQTRELSRQSSLDADRVLAPSLLGYVLLRSGQAEDAAKILRERLAETEKLMGSGHLEPAIQAGLLAIALEAQGKPDAAAGYFDQAQKVMVTQDYLSQAEVDDALQRQIKRFILEKFMHHLVRKATSDSSISEHVFRLADRVNASAVQSALNDAASRAAIQQPKLAELVRKEQDARQEVASLLSYLSGQSVAGEVKYNPSVAKQMQTRLKQIEQERRSIKETLQNEFPDYVQLLQPKPPSIIEIAKQLKSDEVFVQIIPLSEATFVWAILPDGTSRFHVSDLHLKGLHGLVDALRKTLDVADRGAQAPRFDSARAYEIYRRLLQPMESSLAGKKHVIFSTTGPLAQIPFAVLQRRARDEASWLILDFAISYVPTASGWLAIKRLAHRPPAPEPLLAWGDPRFANQRLESSDRQRGGVRAMDDQRRRQARGLIDGSTDALTYGQLVPLPETREEVTRIAKILQANPEQDILLGERATRRSVLDANKDSRLIRKKVLVFATHGLLAGDLPYLSQPALAMAATAVNDESPLLTLEDVLGLSINADWVVLSACNTAGADGKAEEAMSGLARGFFYAGGRSLLVTHWSVESESAMLLTTKTFDAYRRDPTLRRAEAVRRAMLDVMGLKPYKHPGFWSPFALVGEGGR